MSPPASPSLDHEMEDFEKNAEVESKRGVSHTGKQASRHLKASSLVVSNSNTATSTTKPGEKPTLPTLDDDALRRIFNHLDPATSTCLGLTCKALYAVHRRIHGIVNLTAPVENHPRTILADLLSDFFRDPWFSWEAKKYVPEWRYFDIHAATFRRIRENRRKRKDAEENEDEEMAL